MALVQELRGKVGAARAAELGGLQRRVTELQQAAGQDKELASQLQVVVKGLCDELLAAQQERDQLRKTNKQVQSKLETISKAHADTMRQLRAIQGATSSKDADLMERQKRQQQLTQELHTSRRQLEFSKQELQSLELQAHKDKQQLSAEIARVKQDLDKERAARTAAEAAVQRAENALNEVQAAVAAEELRRQKSQNEAGEYTKDLASQLQHSKALCAKLQKELERVQRETQLQLKALEATYAETQNENAATIEMLTQRLSNTDTALQKGLETINKLRATQQRVSELEGELSRSRSEASQAAALAAEAQAALQRAAQEHEAALAEVNRELQECQQQLERYVSASRDIDARAAEAEAALAQVRGNHGDALESLEAQVREHREAAAEARLKCKEKDKAAVALQEQLRATEGQLAEQRAKLSAVAAQQTALQSQAQSFEEEMTKVQGRLDEEQRRAEAAQAALNKHLWEWNSRQELIKKQEKEIQTVVAKLAYAEEGVRRELTCMNCLSVFDNPVTLIPCGHTYCKGCTEAYETQCQECSMPVDSVLPNDRLDTMGGKVTFIQQAVKQLATVRKQHLAAAAEQGASKGAA